jgi:hypothetical protein
VTLTTAWLVVGLCFAALILVIGLCAFDGRERRPPAPNSDEAVEERLARRYGDRDETIGRDQARQEREKALVAQQAQRHRENQARASLRRGL